MRLLSLRDGGGGGGGHDDSHNNDGESPAEERLMGTDSLEPVPSIGSSCILKAKMK